MGDSLHHSMSESYEEEEEDDIVLQARIQALNAARIAAASSSSAAASSNSYKYKWSLSMNKNIGGGMGGSSLISSSSSSHQGHEQQRKLIQQRKVSTNTYASPGTTTIPNPSFLQSPPLQQVHHQNPMEALKAGWEGILEKSQLKLEEIQKDIVKGVVAVQLPQFLGDRGMSGKDKGAEVAVEVENSHGIPGKEDGDDKTHGDGNANGTSDLWNPIPLDNIKGESLLPTKYSEDTSSSVIQEDLLLPEDTDSPNHSEQQSEHQKKKELSKEYCTSQEVTTNSNQSIPSEKTCPKQQDSEDVMKPLFHHPASLDERHENIVTASATTTKTTTTMTTTTAANLFHGQVLKSSIVWKRRSGYGKYSMKNAWEKRRLVLIGSTLFYFDLTNTFIPPDTVELTDIDTIKTTDLASSTSPKNSKVKNDIRQFWEQAKENFTQSIDGVKENIQLFDIHFAPPMKPKEAAFPSMNSDNPKEQPSSSVGEQADPRGKIDLIEENAIVAAVSVTDAQHKWISSDRTTKGGTMAKSVFSNVGTGYCPPPTPFALSIIVRGETKWKICFESQKEHLLWLGLLTDIVIQRSVDKYNEELIKTSVYGTSKPISSSDVLDNTVVSDNIPFSSITSLTAFRSPGDKKGSLWQVEQRYSMTSVLNSMDEPSYDSHTEQFQPNLTNSAHTSNDSSCYIDNKDNITYHESGRLGEMLVEVHRCVDRLSSSGPKLSISGSALVVLATFLNFALYHAFTTESKVLLAILVAFINIIIGVLAVQEPEVHQIPKGAKRSLLANLLGSFSWPSAAPVVKKSAKSFDFIQDNKKFPSEQSSEVPFSRKPPVGSTTSRVDDNYDPNTTINNDARINWMPLDDHAVSVRSHGYLSTKKKIPAPGSLYELIAVDVFRSENQIRQFVTKVDVPCENILKTCEKTWVSPDIFVISLAVPTQEPSFSKSTTDGIGITVVSIYRLKKETKELLKQITSINDANIKMNEDNRVQDTGLLQAAKLFEMWCRESPHDESVQARFKMIPNIHNPKEAGLPSYISKYCGKPVLIKRANVTGFLSDHPEINAMEFNVTLHPFPFLAKKAMAYLYDNVFSKAVISLSYVIEGRDDAELPEALIGDGMKLIRPDPNLIVDATTMFHNASASDFR